MAHGKRHRQSSRERREKLIAIGLLPPPAGPSGTCTKAEPAIQSPSESDSSSAKLGRETPTPSETTEEYMTASEGYVTASEGSMEGVPRSDSEHSQEPELDVVSESIFEHTPEPEPGVTDTHEVVREPELDIFQTHEVLLHIGPAMIQEDVVEEVLHDSIRYLFHGLTVVNIGRAHIPDNETSQLCCFIKFDSIMDAVVAVQYAKEMYHAGFRKLGVFYFNTAVCSKNQVSSIFQVTNLPNTLCDISAYISQLCSGSPIKECRVGMMPVKKNGDASQSVLYCVIEVDERVDSAKLLAVVKSRSRDMGGDVQITPAFL